jgi:transglutaminase-like putative cysteine protease
MDYLVKAKNRNQFLWFVIFGILVGFLAVFVTGTVFAQEPVPVEDILADAPSRSDYPDSDAALLLDEGLVTVTREGDQTLVYSGRIKVFNKEGRQAYGEVVIPYVEDWGEPILNYIRTITPDGKVVEPDKEDIKDVTPAWLQQYPMYSDVKNKVISMPGLTDGAIIDYSYTITQEAFFLEGDFSHSWFFQCELPSLDSRFRVETPGDMNVKWTDFGSDLPPEISKQDDKKTFEWRRTDLEKISEEPQMPPMREIADRLLVTSISSWEYYAEEFWKLAQPQIDVDPDIKEKVSNLTDGLKTREEIVRAIYNYVATDIRYVAIELGRGKIQPHPATEVFHNKYGDCKDKAVLMVSMLKEAGIDSYLVLILSGVGGKTEFSEPPPGRGLNHAIVAVEMEDGLKFLDPTCDVCPYGYLPDSDRGKNALVIRGDEKDIGQIMETDPFSLDDSRVTVHQKFDLSKEGDLVTDIKISYSGFYSCFLKAALEQYSNVRQKQIYRGLLSQLEPGASLDSFDHTDMEDINIDLQLELSYSKSGYANSLGDSLIFQTPANLRIPLSMDIGQMVSLPSNERNYPVLTAPVRLIDEIEYTFPEGTELVTPEGVTVENEWASFVSSYHVEPGLMVVTRKFEIKKPLTPLEGYEGLQWVVNAMRKDDEANFQLKRT